LGKWSYAPKDTSKPVVDELVTSLQASVEDAQFKSRMAEPGAQAVSKDKATPASLPAHLKAEIE
jgi:tripartite-type tricarboxylate transporter receptor subunit TctC